MRKYIFAAILFVPLNAHAGLLSGLIKNDISAVKSEIEKVIFDVKNTFDTRISSVMKVQNEMKADLKSNASAIAGVSNRVSNTNTSQSVGRDIVNDSALMTQYIESIKAGNAAQLDLMWKIIYGTLGVIGTLIALVGTLAGYLHVIISNMLKSRDRNDEREDSRMDALIKKKQEVVP